MSAPSQNDRIEIWRYTYASSSLDEASRAAQYLLANRGLPWDLKKAMVCQIVIAYARPFSKSQVTPSRRITPLAENLVPVQFRDLHREHCEMRHRAVGHKDATAFPSASLNKVMVHIDDRGVSLRTTSVYDISDHALNRTIELCDLLVTRCATELEKYISHFHGEPSGDYLMSTDESPAVWLERQN